VKKLLLTVSLLMTGLLLLTGCEKREDFPTAIDVAEPPRPYDLEVVKTSATMYTLTWTIDDPSLLVDEYKVYSVSAFGQELLGTTDQLQTDVDTVLPLTGLVFGVSSVTTQNVESDLTTAAAPDTILTANRLLDK
jgi:hypothetical protein